MLDSLEKKQFEVRVMIRNFVALLNWNIPIEFRDRKDWIESDGAAMAIDNEPRLYINMDRVAKASEGKIKAALLHELGHTHHRDDDDSDNEYLAQMWALGKAYQLICEIKEGPAIVQAVKEQIQDWKEFPVWEYRHVYDRAVAENIL